MPSPSPDNPPSPVSGKLSKPMMRLVVEMNWPYSVEVFEFVHRGLAHTVQTIHGEQIVKGGTRHVTGRQLCEGLRDCAIRRWGFMARTVLGHWNVTATLDFGRIVFMMVKAGLLKTSDGDKVEDFQDVYDFKTLETEYRISA
jgi:uncharacterized repeat protein (TIGR04138 family)